MQNLQFRLICVEKVVLNKAPMERIVDGHKPIVGAADQPIGHRLPGDHKSLSVPFLLLPVQRRSHHKFLHGKVSYCFRRSIASGDQCRFLRRLNDRGGDAILLAIEAGIGHIDVSVKNDLGRDDLDLFLNLGADGLHDLAAFRALALFLGKRVLDLDDLNILRKNIPCPAGLPLAGMRAYLDRRLVRFRRVFGIDLRLIEQQTELAVDRLRCFLGGRAELLAFQHAQLLKKPLVLLLKLLVLLVFRAGNGYRFRAACL